MSNKGKLSTYQMGPITLTINADGSYVLEVEPWAPRFQDQRGEIREALMDFQRGMERGKTSGEQTIQDVAIRLHDRLTELGITPDPVGPDDAKPIKGLKNCWTCRYNQHPESISGGRFWCNSVIKMDKRYAWVTSQGFDGSGMPDRSADGCPGWEATNEG